MVGGAEMCAVGGGERNRMLKEVEGGGRREEEVGGCGRCAEEGGMYSSHDQR